MQRTVKSTKVALITRGNPDTIEREFFNETDKKKILKNLEKEFTRGSFMIVDQHTTDDLYLLDDETFFKYAVKADKTKSNDSGENTEG